MTYDRRSAGHSGFPETPHTMDVFAGEYLPVPGADHGVTESNPETLDAIESFLLKVTAN